MITVSDSGSRISVNNSPLSIVVPDDKEFRVVGDSGSDTITVEGDMSRGLIIGDEQVHNMYVGSSCDSDTILVKGDMSGGAIFGDVYEHTSGDSTGADNITVGHVDLFSGELVGGNMSDDAAIYGDAFILNDTSAGEDVISILDNMADGVIYGDAKDMNGGIGGADTINLGIMDDKEMSVEGSGGMSGGTVYGDAEAITGGNAGDDTFNVHEISDGVIYGDGERLDYSSAGNDVFNIDIMRGGAIYGDAQTVASTAVGGDTFNIDRMSGGVIYGDVDFSKPNSDISAGERGEENGAFNIFNIGKLSGGEIRAGNFGDKIAIKGLDISSDGETPKIYLGAGADVIRIGNDFAASGADDAVKVYSLDIYGFAVGDTLELAMLEPYREASWMYFEDPAGPAASYWALSYSVTNADGDVGRIIIRFYDTLMDAEAFSEAITVVPTPQYSLYHEISGTAENDVIGVYDEGRVIIGAETGQYVPDGKVLKLSALAGDDSITVHGDMGSELIFGDAEELNNSIAGSDEITVHGAINSSVVIYGDGRELFNTASGDDIIKVFGNMSGNAVIYGDGENISGGSAGMDYIDVEGNMSGNAVVFGDAHTIDSADFSENDDHVNDNILVEGDLSGTAAIYGDAYDLFRVASGNDSIGVVGSISDRGAIYGDAYNIEEGTGGTDHITVGGLSGEGAIYGDTRTISNGSSGSDVIEVTDNMSGRSMICGDAWSMDKVNGAVSNENAGGHDIITVNSMSGGVIYGDACELRDSVAGNDTIDVVTMSDGKIFGDGESGDSQTVAGGNNINVGTMDGGSIYGNFEVDNSYSGGGNDITIDAMSNGTIYAGKYGDNISINAVDQPDPRDSENIEPGTINIYAGNGADIIEIHNVEANSGVQINIHDFDAARDKLDLDNTSSGVWTTNPAGSGTKEGTTNWTVSYTDAAQNTVTYNLFDVVNATTANDITNAIC